MRARLCNVHFFDSCLILTWLLIVGLLFLGLIFTAFPFLKTWLDQRISPESVLPITAVIFVCVSTVRFLQTFEIPATATLVLTYVICLVLYHYFVATPYQWWAPLVPACGISVLVPPSAYVWEKIKPRPRIKRTVRFGVTK